MVYRIFFEFRWFLRKFLDGVILYSLWYRSFVSIWQHCFEHHARCRSQTRIYLVHNLSSTHYTKIFINLIALLNCILMGIPWDGMEWDMHKLLWNGMGWDRKICPMDKPAKPVFDCQPQPQTTNHLSLQLATVFVLQCLFITNQLKLSFVRPFLTSLLVSPLI